MFAFARSLKAWADRENMRYQDLARQLSMSPSSLSDVFRQRNNFTGAQVLAALELMKDPRNLNDAREAIATLEAQIATLKSSPPAVAKSPPTHAAVKPASPAPQQSRLAQLMAEAAANPQGMVFNPEPPMSELSEIDALRVQLNHEPDHQKRGELYQKIKNLEAERRGPQPVGKLRGV